MIGSKIRSLALLDPFSNPAPRRRPSPLQQLQPKRDCEALADPPSHHRHPARICSHVREHQQIARAFCGGDQDGGANSALGPSRVQIRGAASDMRPCSARGPIPPRAGSRSYGPVAPLRLTQRRPSSVTVSSEPEWCRGDREEERRAPDCREGGWTQEWEENGGTGGGGLRWCCWRRQGVVGDGGSPTTSSRRSPPPPWLFISELVEASRRSWLLPAAAAACMLLDSSSSFFLLCFAAAASSRSRFFFIDDGHHRNRKQ